MILKDIYSDQYLIKDNIIPPEVIFGHKGFIPEAYNFGTKENPQRIPLLKELLELCKGKNVKINLEIKTNKKFTLGSINVENNGMDVTIKPDGSIFFYGIENIKLGNINLDDIDWGDLEDHVKNNKLINNLYRIPFITSVMSALQVNPRFATDR